MTNVNNIDCLQCIVDYDKSKLDFDHFEVENSFESSINLTVYNNKNGDLEILFANYLMCTDYNLQNDGVIANLYFKVKETSGKVPLNLTSLNGTNMSEVLTDIKTNPGYININLTNGKIIVCDKLADTHRISGYICTDFITSDSKVNENFIVELSNTNMKATTDANGYFEINSVPTGTYNIQLTKSNFLSRKVNDILIDKNIELSTTSHPLSMWAGDIEINGTQDGSINFEDITAICKSFNSVASDEIYRQDMDFNKDSAINLEDIIVLSKHFNKTASDYQ